MIRASILFTIIALVAVVLAAITSSSSSSIVDASRIKQSPLKHLSEIHAQRTKLNKPFYKDAVNAGVKLSLTPDDCEVRWHTQPVDHFSTQPPPAPYPATYQQRYFICGLKQWNPGQPIFFYLGNECNVALFKNLTGLMYENAPTFGALVVFSEARYFGESLVFPGEKMPGKDKLRYLTTDLILQDHAALASHLKYSGGAFSYNSSKASKVIGFGGSYGGMLATYARIKFPNIFDGSIAGSAPVLNFEEMDPPYNPNAIADVQTNDAGPLPSGEANVPYCADNIRQVWKDIQSMSATASGRAQLTTALRLCSPFNESDLWNYINYLAAPYADLAMSSYSFPSAYLLLGGAGILPAYPMKDACQYFTKPVDQFTPEERVANMLNGLLIYFNASGEFTCLNPNAQVNEDTALTNWLWGYLACSSMGMPTSQTGVTDMFWNAPWDKDAYTQSCQQTYDSTPDYGWARRNFGDIVSYATNIFFSSGSLDIWTPGDVQKIPVERQDKLTAFSIERQGHHSDLFFSNPKYDTPGLVACRKAEVAKIGEWLK